MDTSHVYVYTSNCTTVVDNIISIEDFSGMDFMHSAFWPRVAG